jgi:hypothetical protein
MNAGPCMSGDRVVGGRIEALKSPVAAAGG